MKFVMWLSKKIKAHIRNDILEVGMLIFWIDQSITWYNVFILIFHIDHSNQDTEICYVGYKKAVGMVLAVEPVSVVYLQAGRENTIESNIQTESVLLFMTELFYMY